MYVAAAFSFANEWYANGDESDQREQRRWIDSVNDKTAARPALDLADTRRSVARPIWDVADTALRVCVEQVRGTPMDMTPRRAMEFDGQAALEQMQEAMALGW